MIMIKINYNRNNDMSDDMKPFWNKSQIPICQRG